GTLIEFANLNNWVARVPSIPGAGLWITVTTDGKTRVFPLAGGRVRFEGNFPFAKLTFPDLPVDVTLWCWSPFILHDVRHSAYPVMVFDARLRNRGEKPSDIGLVLSYGTDFSEWLRGIATSHLDMDSTTGFHEWEVLRNAAPGHAVDISVESSGSEYAGKAASGITFSTKALVGPSVRERVHEKRKALEKAYLRAYDFTPVDISGACNRSYLKNPFNEPIATSLCFSDLKPGRRSVYDIPFDVVDEAKNGGKSCVMAGPDGGRKSVSIPVNQKADCLFFFGNCAGWAFDGSAQYVIHYTDGTDTIVPLRNGRDLSDWMGGAAPFSPASITGPNGRTESYVINVFAVPTDGSKTIESVELRKSGMMAPIVFAITIGRLSSLPLVEGVLATRNLDIVRMVGDTDALDLASNTDADYTIAALRRNGGRTLTYRVEDSDSVEKALEGGLQTTSSKASVYAVEQRLSLGPGESGTAGIVCGWYAPNHRSLEGHVYGHKYQDWFGSSSDVVEEVARDHDELLRKTKEHFDIIATSTLPRWYREMIQSNFYLLPACTWLTRDGISFTYESPDRCPAIGTLDVRYYGSFTKLAAFPELDEQELRGLGESQHGDGFV
ncbi:MAG: GH116 family glycosyl-hydrolase, partial [Armatimonadetes bacterium]|nr:GH116 family glycosyl-hydrolase [Armatimonadota bacterium]